MLPERWIYGGWPNSGEIDVMEAVGHEPDRFFGTVHTNLYNGMLGTQKGGLLAKAKMNGTRSRSIGNKTGSNLQWISRSTLNILRKALVISGHLIRTFISY